MEPISFTTGYLLGKSIDKVTDKFKSSVIERWAKARAKVFLEEFYRETALLNNILLENLTKINLLINKILDDKDSSELLFDAYRSISLSKSKIIGPKLIAIITAKCINEKRKLDEFEDEILSIAESCSDNELINFKNFVLKEYNNAINPEKKDTFIDNDEIRVKWMSNNSDSSWEGSKLSLSPLNLVESLGFWSRLFQNYGIILTDVTEENIKYYEDSERHIDEDGMYKEIIHWIYFSKKYVEFAELINLMDDVSNSI
jgi:hypothetical protein